MHNSEEVSPIKIPFLGAPSLIYRHAHQIIYMYIYIIYYILHFDRTHIVIYSFISHQQHTKQPVRTSNNHQASAHTGFGFYTIIIDDAMMMQSSAQRRHAEQNRTSLSLLFVYYTSFFVFLMFLMNMMCVCMFVVCLLALGPEVNNDRRHNRLFYM